MRVLVVGGTGNVGQRLVEALVASPDVERVVAAARREPETLPTGVDWRTVDLANDLPIGLLRDVDAVVHLAWLFQPTHAPTTTWTSNVVGTSRLLDAAASAGVRVFVHASSVGAYSPHPSPDPVDESWPTHAVATAAYSREKSYVERLLDVFERDHPETRVVRLRPAFTFREEAAVAQRRLFGGPFVPTTSFRRVRLPVLPDPGGIRFQAVHTDDVVAAYRLALSRPVSGAFNIAAEPALDMAAIAELFGARVVRVPRALGRAAIAAAWTAHLAPASPGLFDLLCNVPLMRTDRARDELGWQPRYDALTAIQALLAGLDSGAGGPTPPLSPATSGRFRSHEFATGIGRRP